MVSKPHLLLEEPMTVKLRLYNYCESRLIGCLHSTANILLLSLISFWIWPLYADTGAGELSVKFQEKIFSTAASSVTPTSNGGFLIVGNLFDDAGPSSWGWVTRIGSHGEIKWQKEFGKKAKNSDFLKAVTTTRRRVMIYKSASSALTIRCCWRIGIAVANISSTNLSPAAVQPYLTRKSMRWCLPWRHSAHQRKAS